MELAFIHTLRSHREPDEFSTGWNLVSFGVPFTHNHLNRTKILAPGSSKFRVNRAKNIEPSHVNEMSGQIVQPVENSSGVMRNRFRACLHGGGGPQVGEVTRLRGVTRLSK